MASESKDAAAAEPKADELQPQQQSESTSADAATGTLESSKAVDSKDEEDEDDWDDDILDEFSPSDSTKPGPQAERASRPSSSTSMPAAGPSSTVPGSSSFDEEFTKALEADLGSVMSAINENPEAKRELEELTRQLATSGLDFEGIMKDAEAADEIEEEMAEQGGKAPQPAGDSSFQDTIRRTMENLEESGRKAGAEATKPSEDDLLEALLRALSEGGEGGGFGSANGLPANDEEMNQMFAGMFQQLSEKELMYEPMKELDDKYNGWMDSHRADLSPEELTRYTEQRRIVREIVAKYEDPSYTDDDPQARGWLFEKMQQMQATGNPPENLVENPWPGLLPTNDPETQCPQQ